MGLHSFDESSDVLRTTTGNMNNSMVVSLDDLPSMVWNQVKVLTYRPSEYRRREDHGDQIVDFCTTELSDSGGPEREANSLENRVLDSIVESPRIRRLGPTAEMPPTEATRPPVSKIEQGGNEVRPSFRFRRNLPEAVVTLAFLEPKDCCVRVSRIERQPFALCPPKKTVLRSCLHEGCPEVTALSDGPVGRCCLWGRILPAEPKLAHHYFIAARAASTARARRCRNPRSVSAGCCS